jgi:hypothetical protein
VGSFIGVENVVWTLSIRCQKKQVYGFVDAAHICVFFFMHKTQSGQNSLVVVGFQHAIKQLVVVS